MHQRSRRCSEKTSTRSLRTRAVAWAVRDEIRPAVPNLAVLGIVTAGAFGRDQGRAAAAEQAEATALPPVTAYRADIGTGSSASFTDSWRNRSWRQVATV